MSKTLARNREEKTKGLREEERGNGQYAVGTIDRQYHVGPRQYRQAYERGKRPEGEWKRQ